MSNTLITARVNDQSLQLANTPLLASGSEGVLQIRCEFDALWDGYGKVGVFYRTEEVVYHKPVVDGVVTVPHEVLTEDGHFFFGLAGFSENTRTTEVLRVNVVKGAITSATAVPAEPTPSLYTQLLQGYDVLTGRMNELTAMKHPGGVTDYLISDEYILGSIRTNGSTAYIEFDITALSLIGGGHHYSDYCIPPALQPLGFLGSGSVELQTTNPDINVTLEYDASNDSANGWSRLLIENVSSDTYISDMVTRVYGYYPLESVSIAELADIRVDVEGKVHASAGEAVRSQIAECYEENAEKERLEREWISFTAKFPVPQKPEFVKKSGAYNGCLSDIHTVGGVDVLYGFSGRSVVRSASGNDCGSPSILMTKMPETCTVNFVKKLNDGSLLVGVENAGDAGIAKIYKGTAETWNATAAKFEVTWTEVLACETKNLRFSMWFGLSVYNNTVVVGEYGATNAARSVYISKDYGATWTKIFTVDTDGIGAGAHIHDVCYDPYSDVVWVCTGDGYWAQNIYWSYDGGATWNKNYGVKESPSQFTQILPLPNCILFTTDNAKHMAVYRCDRSQLLNRKTHLDLVLAYSYYDGYNAESPIGSNGAVVYGKNACVYFGWTERYDAVKTKSPVVATKDGFNFFVIWESDSVAAAIGGYVGIYGVCGVTDNGNLGISYVCREDGTTGKHSIIMKAPDWKTWETMFD